MIYRKKLTQFYEKEGCEIILAIDELSVSSAPVVSKRFNWTLLSTPVDGINLVFAFNPFPKNNLLGDIPVWIRSSNIEDEYAPQSCLVCKANPIDQGSIIEGKLNLAMNNVKDMICHDTKAKVVLRHDTLLPLSIKVYLKKMALTKKKGGCSWMVKDAEKFDGCESDIIVYVGNGYIKGLTRAKLKLFIITLEEYKVVLQGPTFLTVIC